MTVLLGVVAFAFDGGIFMDDQQREQSTADASALAAACQLYKNWTTYGGLDNTTNDARTAAQTLAAQNGFTLADTDVLFNPSNYSDGPNKGTQIPKGYVEVTVRYSQKRFFSRVFGSANVTIKARAVARGSWEADKDGILILDPSGSSSLKANGGGTVSVVGAPLIVNSTAPDAGNAVGGGNVSAGELNFGGSPGTSGSGTWTGTIKTNQAPTPDPLLYLPQPNPASMIRYGPEKLSGPKTDIISPGVYTGGISVSGQGSLTMLPGIYYMDGGGFSFSGSGSLYAAGVMIFNDPKSNSDNISITGSGNGGSITLSPPTSGLYTGISLFQERSATNTMSISGNGSTSMTGTFYTAHGTLNVTGNGAQDVLGSQYISYDLVVGGNGNFSVVWNQNLVGRVRKLQLVE